MDLRRRLTRRLAAAACATLVALPCRAQAPLRVLDVDGHAVVLAAPARRVVSLAPHLTELMFAISAGDRVVGTVEYADFPAAAKQVPRVGDSALLDLERVVALRPELLLVWRHGNSPQQLERLATLGIPTYASEARTLSDIARTLRDLGALTGSPEPAQRQAQAFEDAVTDLRARYASRRRIDVFYQIWNQPLITVNGDHLISQVLALCGARNVFASERLLTPTVTEEAVLLTDPDAIVAGRSDSYGETPLGNWRRLRALRATRQGHLLQVNPDLLHRQSDRVVLGARELCEKLDAVRATLPGRR
ncbi:MAG TPA: cobalamin-binding protein [Burkholderiaceae bacterium]|nr:cobalamin-binding protein [Burkholderiaceae bacterium]